MGGSITRRRLLAFTIICTPMVGGLWGMVAAGAAPAQPQAMRVTLHMHGVSAQQVLEEVTRQTHVGFDVAFKPDADRLLLTKVSVDADAQPFWSTVLQICEAAQLRPTSMMRHRPSVSLSGGGGSAGAWNSRFTVVQGAFAVSLLRVEQNSQIEYGARRSLPPQGAGVTIQVCPEPGAHAQTPCTIALTRCEDERGFPLATGGVSRYQPLSIPVMASLQIHPQGANRISVLEGEVTMRMETAWQHMEAAKISQAQDAPESVDGIRLSITPIRKMADHRWELQIIATADGKSPEEMKVAVERLWNGEPQLYDAAGHELIFNGRGLTPQETAEGYPLRFSFSNMSQRGRDVAGEPVKLVWDVPTRTADVTVPFSFKDVPLPSGGVVGTSMAHFPSTAPFTAPAVGVVGETTPDYSKRSAELVGQLGAVSADERQTAEIRLSLVPPDAFPLIEAAAGRADLPPASAVLLRKVVSRQRPWQAARVHRAKVRDDEWRWDRQTALDAYRRV